MSAARQVYTVEPYAAFYEQPHSMSEFSLNYHIDVNFDFVTEFEKLADEEFGDIVNGIKTLDQALADLQNEAKAVLDAMVE